MNISRTLALLPFVFCMAFTACNDHKATPPADISGQQQLQQEQEATIRANKRKAASSKVMQFAVLDGTTRVYWLTPTEDVRNQKWITPDGSYVGSQFCTFSTHQLWQGENSKGVFTEEQKCVIHVADLKESDLKVTGTLRQLSVDAMPGASDCSRRRTTVSYSGYREEETFPNSHIDPELLKNAMNVIYFEFEDAAQARNASEGLKTAIQECVQSR